MIVTVAVGCVLVWSSSTMGVEAFQVNYHRADHPRRSPYRPTRSLSKLLPVRTRGVSSSSSSLFFSDIPKEPYDEKLQKNKKRKEDAKDGGGDDGVYYDVWRDEVESKFKFDLPPPPEDRFVMAGDLLSLFVYAFFDHFVCVDLASFVNAAAANDRTAVAAATSSSSADFVGDHIALSAPVWLDMSTSSGYRDHVLHVLLSDQTVTQYSPLLQPTWLAGCLLASAWLLAGWWHRSFAYKNTLDCSPDRVLTVTAKTWVTSCLALMVGVAASNSVLLGPHHQIGLEWWQTFKKGDVEYIWDSLTVLCMWRFMASSLLGSGGNCDDDSGDHE